MTVAQDGYREILLAGTPIPMRTVLPETDLRVFPGKVTIGDYTEDSHPLLSTWVISDLSGGHGVEDMNEGSDINRYRIGTLYTRYPKQFSNPPKVTDIAASMPGYSAISEDLIWFLGDMKGSGTWTSFFLIDDTVYRGNPPSSLTSVATIAESPVGNAVVYQGSGTEYLVVPHGASGTTRGYSLITSSAVTHVFSDAAHPNAVAFLVWDNKLIALDAAGQLWFTTDLGSAWTSYGPTAKLPTSAEPRALVPYFDRQGLPSVFIVTDTDVWQADLAGPSIFTVDVYFPPHPYHGLAACRWSGDLYFSVGAGVHRYTGGSLSAMGLDRDSGLPLEYSGYIVGGGLISGYNAIYAFVQGTNSSTPTDVDGVSIIESYNSLHEWTGTGWHMIWQEVREQSDEFTDRQIVPFSMGISRGGGNYRLYWCTYDLDTADQRFYYIDLPVSYSNPRQIARTSGGAMAGSFYLETPVFDAGMRGYKKIANAIDVSLSNTPATGTLTVKYRADGATDWTDLGATVQGQSGTYTLPFGVGADVDAGLVFERIQFRFEMDGATTDSFILNSAVLSFIKTMPGSLAWTADVKLDTEYKGKSPAQLREHIRGILDNRAFVPMIKNGTTYRVYLSQIKGASESGFDERGNLMVSILQIPTGLGA